MRIEGEDILTRSDWSRTQRFQKFFYFVDIFCNFLKFGFYSIMSRLINVEMVANRLKRELKL